MSSRISKPKPRQEVMVLIERRKPTSPTPSKGPTSPPKAKPHRGRKKGTPNKNLELHALRAKVLEQNEQIRAFSDEILALRAQISANSQPFFNPTEDLESWHFARQNESLFDFFE
ncbi:hypothetical protein E4T38_09946 [Aureobasidium subglaciale]|nr:hypothetical protein E4T38_09946 [Aureobasidium subglaciale]KAI5213056.1 hypothetical protein E4T40_09950 [Aureobasidium subglaciale]KAI5214147.1 hypothetical protein E4T41_09961 [Aureobasidium subglaciale]KAI5252310.1 hypothetical protein E4T46_09953 [Aureobasidium subglaciale]